MEQEEISEILTKQDDGKLDSYLQKTANKKEDQHDLMNIVQTWSHSLLYHKNIYPQDAFCQRNILGATVYVASAVPLKQYLDQFFQKLKNHLDGVNHLQIIILSEQGKIIETNTLHLADYNQVGMVDESQEPQISGGNAIQRDIQLKAFLVDLDKKMKEGYRKGNQTVSFRFRIGYRFDTDQEDSQQEILNNWVKVQREQKKGRVLSSFKNYNLNIIYQIQQ